VEDLSAELDLTKDELAAKNAQLETAKAQAEPKAPVVDVLQLQNRLAEAEATMRAAEKRVVDAESHARELQVRLDEAEEKLKNDTAAAPFGAIAASATRVELPGDNAEAISLPGVDDVISEQEQPAAAAPRKRRRRPKKDLPRISAIDESMDSTEWLVSTPPEGVNMKVSTVSDAEFGYQAPPRKPQPPVNDAQMVLF
jgi:hypothetical protein